MEAVEVIDVIREGMYVLLLISAPVMITALVVGLVISLFQALTQIQEQTLTFVPKVVSMLLVLGLALPFMLRELTDYSNKLSEKIVHIE